MLVQSDSLEFLKSIKDYDNDIIYCDPPYALGSEVIIRKDGKVDYAKANDFMSKWEMPTGDYWEKWFNEAYRTLKHGGWLIMFGMDRQLLLFKYYAHLAGFEEQQSLYWYFISNFPKATDLSKMIDKNAGIEFEKGVPISENVAMSGANYSRPEKQDAQTELAQKYDGYKYSISPLKQTNETIMVFKKPTKTGSVLHDTLAYENGDTMITVGALNIDGNRVGTETRFNQKVGNDGKEVVNIIKSNDEYNGEEVSGRYPAQTFIDDEISNKLDKQSDNYSMSEYYEGGCSKILHKCDYEQTDYDLYFYEPKVSSSERNAGCDGFYKKRVATLQGSDSDGELDDVSERFRTSPSGNNHPTLKPIELNHRVLKLFKTPNDQKICYPFGGAGSEIIGGIKAGFDNLKELIYLEKKINFIQMI